MKSPDLSHASPPCFFHFSHVVVAVGLHRDIGANWRTDEPGGIHRRIKRQKRVNHVFCLTLLALRTDQSEARFYLLFIDRGVQCTPYLT